MTDQPTPLFKGEAMLLSWGDTSSRGKTVTFALHPDECGDVHPFRGLGTGKTGQRFAIVAVPITDDEETSPGEQQAASATATVGASPPPRSTGSSGGAKRERTLPEKVGILCGDRAFQVWAATQIVGCAWLSAEGTADWVRQSCGVKSRKEILPGTDAAIMWSSLLLQFEHDTGRMAEERQ